MKVILLQDIRKVGKKFEIKDVSDGYAINMLIPRKLAETATDSAVKRIQ
jgi:large subunit ribosomal protein L9